MRFVQHDFYCINCGNKIYTIPRKQSLKKEKFHRKALYCPFCKLDCNSIEIRNDTEKDEFLQMFKGGEFKEEAKESIKFIKEHNWFLL